MDLSLILSHKATPSAVSQSVTVSLFGTKASKDVLTWQYMKELPTKNSSHNYYNVQGNDKTVDNIMVMKPNANSNEWEI